MELHLQRVYHAQATNGSLYLGSSLLCYTIELVWLQNKRNRSCIPEGVYPLQLRYSSKFQWHLHVQEVPERTLILIHPANDAQQELRGCIAPVMDITAPGHGTNSIKAMHQLMRTVLPAFEQGKQVLLYIETVP